MDFCNMNRAVLLRHSLDGRSLLLSNLQKKKKNTKLIRAIPYDVIILMQFSEVLNVLKHLTTLRHC